MGSDRRDSGPDFVLPEGRNRTWPPRCQPARSGSSSRRTSLAIWISRTEEIGYLLDLCQKVKKTPTRYANALNGPLPEPAVRKAVAAHAARPSSSRSSSSAAMRLRSRARSASASRSKMSPAIWTAGPTASSRASSSQRTIDELAQWSHVPVINALSDLLSSLPGAGRRADAAGALRRACAGSSWRSSATATTWRIR